MRKLINLILLAALLFSCEYEPDGNNFKNIEPPDEMIYIDITLNDIAPNDTIYMFENTLINVRINTGGREVKQLSIYINENEHHSSFNQSYYSFQINSYDLDWESNDNTLTINSIIGAGTGSLADIMGLEGYLGELTWHIKYIHNSENFIFDHRKTEDGFMEIFWDFPDVPDRFIDRYEVRMDFKTVTIQSSQKSIIDYDYTCGRVNYTISVYIKGYNYSLFWKDIYPEYPEPTLYFEDIDLDKLRVYWDKPFANARFDLAKLDESPLISEYADTSIVIPQIPFGLNQTFCLRIIPERSTDPEQVVNVFGWHYFGKKLNLNNFSKFAYSKTPNLIISSYYDNVVIFDATTMNEVSRVHIQGLSSSDIISCAPNSTQVALNCDYDIRVYQNTNFTNPVIFNWEFSYNSFRLADKNQLFIFEGEYSKLCHIFNSQTGSKTHSFQYSYYPSNVMFERCNSVSSDGKYLCCCSTKGIEIFEITETEVLKVYSDNRYYLAAMFHPTQPNVLVVKERDNIEIWDITTFDIEQTTLLALSTLYNIDPVTGNLLYRQENFLKIATLENPDQPLLAIPIVQTYDNYQTPFCLLNQILLSNDGVALNIAQYLKL